VHTPAPTLTSIPMAMECDNTPRGKPGYPNLPRSDKKVLVQNLPISVDFERISQMAKRCGNVVAIQIHSQDKSAVVEFSDPKHAENFTRQHNRKMMDLAIITATRLS